MGTHSALPLAVYKDDQYVQPAAVNATLKYALVEVHFTLKHFCIRKRDAKPLDSFTGLIQQIVVLKAGEARAAANYKWKILLDGPFRPKPFQAPLVMAPKDTTPTMPAALPSLAPTHATTSAALDAGAGLLRLPVSTDAAAPTPISALSPLEAPVLAAQTVVPDKAKVVGPVAQGEKRSRRAGVHEVPKA